MAPERRRRRKLADFQRAVAQRDMVIRKAQFTPASRKKLAERGIVRQQRPAS